MGRLMIALLALFALAPAATAQERDEAVVVVTSDGEDLLVTITLDHAVERFAFDRGDVVRDDAIEVVTPGLTYAEDAISGDAPFDSVVFRLREDVTERDAKYPPYYRVGASRLLYAQTIYPDTDAWDVTLALEGMPEGWSRWPETPLPQGYLFLGPDQDITREGGVLFVTDGNGTPEFNAQIRSGVAQSLAFLTELFGSPPASTPFVATSILEGDSNSMTGDVTADAMIALRFIGLSDDAGSPRMLSRTRSLVLHEGVHFWNGGVAQFAPDTPMWLHEGGAEYIATLASWRFGWTPREALTGSFGQWLGRCRTALSRSDEIALNDLDFIPSSMRYTCGPLLQLLTELYLADGGHEETVFDAWRKTVQTARTGDGFYNVPAFYAAAGAPDLLESPALAAILATSGPGRWDTVLAEMQRLGMGIEERSSPPLRARTVLMHVIRSQCTGLGPGEGYGFYSGQDSYRLDTPEGCGMLAGNPVVESLEGETLTGMTADAYAFLQHLCATGSTIGFERVGEITIEVPCTSPLPDAATEPVITALPDIPAFSE